MSSDSSITDQAADFEQTTKLLDPYDGDVTGVPAVADPSTSLGVGTTAPRKLRIFLSYGHDAFEELAIRLAADLHGRGHDVWFDKRELVAGTQWEYEIEKGINWASEGGDLGWVLLLMTPYSVRRPGGYCLNELERAQEKRIQIAPIMVVTCEQPLSIDRLQYFDMRDCVPLAQQIASYERKFEMLCLVLEGKQALAIEGEMQRLYRALRPTSYELDTLFYLPHFTGRQWVIRAFDEWLADSRQPPVFWITGAFGTGKSALAAWLCEHRKEVRAFHVCGYFDRPKGDYREVVRSIAWQLSNQLPNYAQLLNEIGEIEMLCKDPDVDLFDRLIVQPAHGLPAPESPVVVLIDALDEATAQSVNTLAGQLGREVTRLPSWFRFALTSAPDEAVTVPLQAWKPIELESKSDENIADVIEYVNKYIAPISPTGALESKVLERILDASEYNWLYLDWLRRSLEQGLVTLENIKDLPHGIGGAYHHEFSRRFPDLSRYRQINRPFLSVLAAAREPLQIGEYADVLRCSEADIKDIVRDLGGLLSVYENHVRPFHYALIRWLTDDAKSGEYSVSQSDGHRTLADNGWVQFTRGPESMRPYAKAHLPGHLLESGELDKLYRCVTNTLFIAERFAADTVYELARYWSLVAPFRLRELCDGSFAALTRRGIDVAVCHTAALGTGQLFQQVGMYDAAILYFRKALPLSCDRPDPVTAGQANLNIGWCLRHMDEFKRAITYTTVAIKHFQEGGSREGKARALSVRGICHWHLRDDLAALDDLQAAASLYRACRDDRSCAEALNHLGIVHRSLGMYKEALGYLKECQTLSTRFKDRKALGKCLNSLGTAYWWMGKLETAIKFYREADRCNEEVNQPYILGLTANNIGYVYLEKGQYQQAYEAFARARAIRRQLGILSYEMLDVSGMALASYYLERWDEARDLSQKAVSALRKFRAAEDLERAYYNHYVIMLGGGTRCDRARGAKALRSALALVKSRMRKISDEKILTRFQASVPLVKAICDAARTVRRKHSPRNGRRLKA
jgi:tetratricopeptide (TPR) repeat protein